MSKASEWADQYCALDATKPRLWNKDNLSIIAMLTDQGKVFVAKDMLPPDEALRLARWILDTCGEQEG